MLKLTELIRRGLRSSLALAALLILWSPLFAAPQAVAQRSETVRAFVAVDAPIVALTHVRVIDGTGAPARDDQTIVIEQGRIESIASSASAAAPPNAKVLDLSGHAVIPGLVGMHDHLFYPIQFATTPSTHFPPLYGEQGFSFPRLYLACGVTSLRTTGSIEPYTDLSLKKLIDAGQQPGPKMHITGPYLEGTGAYTPQMHELSGAEDAARTVNYWADEDVTSFKAYMHITRDELRAAIEAAHHRGLKLTGHLCSVGFREAADLGIDDLEHGLLVDTEFDPGKKPDVCPHRDETSAALAKLDLASAPVQDMIKYLVAHHVAITSTLSIFETFLPNRPPLDQRVLDALAPVARLDYLTLRARTAEGGRGSSEELLKKEMQFERDFVKAGGLLLAGEDPTGYGGDLAGFGDQRELELLVEAGFTPFEAIHIATANGAEYLGEAEHTGTLSAGKQADLVVVDGDPSTKISDIEKVTVVFRDGVGYDPAKLIDSVRGAVGLH